MKGLDTYIGEGLLTSPLGDMHKEGMQMLHEKELRAYVAEITGRFSDITRHFDEYVDWVDENTIDLHPRGGGTRGGGIYSEWGMYDSKFPAPDWLHIRNLGISLVMMCRLPRSKAPECWPQNIVTDSYGPSIPFMIYPGVRSLEGYRFNFQSDRPSDSGFIYLRNDGVHDIEIPHLGFEISGNCQRVFIVLHDKVPSLDIFNDIKIEGPIRVNLSIPYDSYCWAPLPGEFSSIPENNHRLDTEVDRLLVRLPKGIDTVHITKDIGGGVYNAMYNKDNKGNDTVPVAYHRIGIHFKPVF